MPSDLTKAREQFLHAVGHLPPEQWNEYVADACQGDADLQRRVRHLLQVHGEAGSFLATPAIGRAAPEILAIARGEYTPPGVPAECPGTMIGPYRLSERIGEGGMGVVWLAEQEQPVRRRVALKIIKAGMDTAQVVARFEAERQALALMEHPNVARVFDAGATDSGRPYFVMELVRGLPITDYCDQARLPVRERLALFVAVCRAVQHAHQRGVIHRDLKPTNVLVTVIDGAAIPKIIDFGVAKATGQKLTERTLQTGFHQLVGTPLYMSPEQAELSGVDVDTRTDVYALGVLLYELLTGSTPFDAGTMRAAAFDELRRIIREDNPPAPSRRIATLGAVAASTVSERRAVDARQFGHVLRGDLDWVVMKALEKDRNRRYESASAFAQDVERYLAGEAVVARPPSAAYRLRKFAGRNKAAVLAGVVIVASLVTATAVSVWQAAVARAAQKQAVNEAAIASAIRDFLQNDLLGRVSPPVPLDGGPPANPTLNVREALDWAAANVGGRFQDQPLVEAEMRLMIGKAYTGIREPERAVPQLQRVIALRTAHLGHGHRDTLFGVLALEGAYEAGNRLDDALALLADWRGHFQATFGTEGFDASQFGFTHGRASYFAGKLDDAERSMRAALEIRRQADPVNRGKYPLMWLSRIHFRQGKYEAAEAAARESLTILDQVTNAPAWHRSEAMTLLGRVLVGRKKYAEAEPLLLKGYEGLAECEDTMGPPQVNWRLAEAIEWVARLYEATNRQDKARAWREKLGPPRRAAPDR